MTGVIFIFGMATITSTDLELEYLEKLEGYLKPDYFFGVAKFPTASLILKKVKSTGKTRIK